MASHLNVIKELWWL